MNLDPEDIPELKEIVETPPDNYTRERAIFVLTDIAIRKDVPEEVVDFLKDIAYNERNEDVVAAAYANLYLIRETYPLEMKGDLTIRVEGEIKKGNNVTVVADASSAVDVSKAIVRIKEIVEYESNKRVDITLWSISPNPLLFDLTQKYLLH